LEEVPEMADVPEYEKYPVSEGDAVCRFRVELEE